MEDKTNDKDNNSKVTFTEPDSHQSDDSTASSEDWDTTITCTTCDKKFSGEIPFKQHLKSQSHKKAERRKRIENKINQEEDSNHSDSDDLLSLVMKPVKVCNICKKDFTSHESYSQHLKSKVHKRKVKEDKVVKDCSKDGEFNEEMYLEKMDHTTNDELEDIPGITNPFDCQACDKSFTGIKPYTQHMRSKIHHKKVKQLEMLKHVVKEDNVHYSDVEGLGRIENEDGILVCKLCKMSFSGPENASAHLKSRGHKKKLNRQEFLDKHKTSSSSGVQQRAEADIHPRNDEEGHQKLASSDNEIVEPVQESYGEACSPSAKVAVNEPGNSDTSHLSFEAHLKYKTYKKLMNDAKAINPESSTDGSKVRQNHETLEPTDSVPDIGSLSISTEVDLVEPKDDRIESDRGISSKYKECKELISEAEDRDQTEQSQDQYEIKIDETLEPTDSDSDMKCEPYLKSAKVPLNDPSSSDRSESSPSIRPKYEKYKKLFKEVKHDLTQ